MDIKLYKADLLDYAKDYFITKYEHWVMRGQDVDDKESIYQYVLWVKNEIDRELNVLRSGDGKSYLERRAAGHE